MKQSKEDLLKKIDTLEIPDETKVVLMEDITDSFVEEKADDEYKEKYDELLDKYKARFLDGTEPANNKPLDVDDGIQEKPVVDIKEI